jgi:hypothetical protein
LESFHLIFIEYIFTIGVGFIMSVTNALMRRGAELVATHMQSSDKPQQQQPNGGVVALFSITVVLFCFAFWAVSDTISQM